MPERGGQPLFGRDAVSRRRGAARVIAASLAASVLLAAPVALPRRPLFVWNATASAPIGLYRIGSARGLARGDVVLARLPSAAQALAARRQYLPAGVPIVKRAVALGGAHICAAGRRITIDHRLMAIRLVRDSQARPMPGWQGCRRLGSQAVFLLGDGPDSFDSRYFGPVPRDSLIGRAALLWHR